MTLPCILFILMFLRIAVCGLLLISALAAQPNISVVTSCGPIIGKAYTSRTLQECHGFLGVPFAKPPVGALRFTRPQPVECWTDTLIATSYKGKCAQTDPYLKLHEPPVPDSEDCLYLNIFTPAARSAATGYPVMVWIHGGGFSGGGASDFGDQGICDNLVSRDVVVVTVQYRLGAFGFFATDDSATAGNWGIWDQVEALKWISNNIAAFGGNPSKITIFGVSAGGASVSLLHYIDDARDYFHQAIIQSGSSFADWALDDDVLESSKILMEAAHCSSVDCLRQKSVTEILAANAATWAKLQNNKNTGDIFREAILWNPRIDGQLLKEHPENLVDKIPPKPTIIGTCHKETAIFKPPEAMKHVLRLSETLPDSIFSADFFTAELTKLIKSHNLRDDVVELALDMALWFYLEGREASRDNTSFVLEQFMMLHDDNAMNLPALLEARARALVGASVWLYNFDHYSTNLISETDPIKASTHAFELPYIFRSTVNGLFEFKFNDHDEFIAELMGELWTNFAKHGSPTSDKLKLAWLPIGADVGGSAVNLRINSTPKLDAYFHHTSTSFLRILHSLRQRRSTESKRMKIEL